MLIIGFTVFPVERFVGGVVVVAVVVVVLVVVVILYVKSPLVSNKYCTFLAIVKLLHIGVLHVYSKDDSISVSDIVFDSSMTP